MTTLFLTQSEINEIAAPLTQPAAISRWFLHNGFYFKSKPNGMPLISREHYESVMSGNPVPNALKTTPAEQSPDVANFLSQFKTKRKAAQPA